MIRERSFTRSEAPTLRSTHGGAGKQSLPPLTLRSMLGGAGKHGLLLILQQTHGGAGGQSLP